MANSSSRGHMLIVRRQSYIPSYFSVYESQLPMNNECSEYKLEAAESELRCARFYLLHSGKSTPEYQLHTGYFTFPLWRKTENFMESETHTTRLLSSGLAKRFSCNVSKMAYRMRNRMVCDGYYGCPDENICTEKGSGKITICFPITYLSIHILFQVDIRCIGNFKGQRNEVQYYSLCSVKIPFMYYSFTFVWRSHFREKNRKRNSTEMSM